ncbi:MAG: protein TolR [Desulfobulbaceae bacterium]|uniref:Cell division and transport-associated protein TolR n=2 Tax=Desulfofustis glycolicus TaxID=51195 RepID=A0A1M5U626_9BACT|nr:protein TolR [Desulfobulbaceae bacterium]SHH58457.1 Cell division and transport-associated protein TolR [Desulfofustis glycolicus DSM 9705]
MGMSTGNGRKQLMADINVTPLVDVMLVLLIIFMITAPMMTQGLDVDLPETTAKSLRQDDDPIVVTIDKDGVIGLGNLEGISQKVLLQELAKVGSTDTDKPIYLKADKAVPYGIVVSVMADIKKAGFDKLGMVTQPSVEEKP